MGENERRRARSAKSDKALGNRANRRRREQPLASIGTTVDGERAEQLESQVFHRKPTNLGAKPGMGREATARQRRRNELKERTLRRGRGRLELSEFEDEP